MGRTPSDVVPTPAGTSALTPGGPAPRTRADQCPGAWRPWPAADGLLVRLRVPGGHVSGAALVALAEVARRHGDGRVRPTSRANLQVRGLPAGPDGRLPADVLDEVVATGLLPSPAHDLVRNVMTSPATGLSGGRADLRQVTAELDQRIRAAPDLAELPGRFLFVLDDGRGDLVARSCDLGLVALDAATGQLRVGEEFTAVLPLTAAPATLVELAHAFGSTRGEGPGAPWHVAELTAGLEHPAARPAPVDPRVPAAAPALAFGPLGGGWRHVAAPEQGWDTADLAPWAHLGDLVVTPYSGLLVPDTPDPPGPPTTRTSPRRPTDPTLSTQEPLA